jgi:hypothetical protein
MRKPVPRVLIAFFLLTLASVVSVFAFGPVTDSQVAVEPDARPTPDFGRLAVSPLNLSFKALNFNAKRPQPPFETHPFTIENTGRNSNTLFVTVSAITGINPTSFSISPGPGPTVIPLAPGKANAQHFDVTFTPITDGRVTADIVITSTDSSGQRGVTMRTIHLVGNARGPIPTPSITPTPSATSTPTSTPLMTTTPTPSPTQTPLLTPTPTPTPTAAPGQNLTDRNSANAPGILISGHNVSVFVPEGSYSENNTGTYQVVVENAASPLPSPTLIATDRVTSCAPALSGQVVCSGQGGTVDLIPAATGTPSIQNISPLPGTVNYAGGDCIACGAMVDDKLGLGIISTGAGFYLQNLPTGALSTAIATNTNSATGPDPLEVPGEDFGYDSIHHLILSANWQVTDLQTFMSSPPHFQIINIANPENPVVYDLANDLAIFKNNNRTCGSTMVPSDDLPDTTAYDSSIGIAFVSFHNKSDCFSAPPDDIAMFDLTQAKFSPSMHTWTTPAMLIQSITGTALNGIDAISVESNDHLALVANGTDNNIGVLQLPAASGGNSASLAITDWVNAQMPSDPDRAQWVGWGEPNGIATYVSPNTGKPIGVLMNNPAGGGGSTYLALIDMEALLNAPRDNAHQIFTPIASPIVTFVKIK